jgi:Subtilase family
MSNEQLPHLIVEGFFGTEKYTAVPRRGAEFPLPARDRAAQGTTVREQLERIRGQNEQQRGVETKPNEPARITLEVRSEPGFVLNLDSLENRSRGIEVACVRQEGDVQIATLHVPEGALIHFLKRAEEYLTRQTGKGNARHQDLIDRITELRLATLRSFWTEEEADFPATDNPIWWEIWLRAVGDQSPWDSFRMLAEANGLQAGKDTIRFPDRLVGLIYGTADQIMASLDLLDMIGEVRRAKENPAAFIALEPKEQAQYVDNLRSRITAPSPTAPAVCLLDSGVVFNPLVRPALDSADCHRFDPSWPLTDSLTHGTEMAGVALFGNRLAELLAGSETVPLRHRLESVKILPPPPWSNEPRLYGHVTAQAASRVEIAAPERNRAFCLPVTTDGRDKGRPSSWSAVIDQLCAGINDDNPRLFFVAAGNSDPNQRHLYPDSNDTDPVQDPAQAWNAISVGACTDCVQFDQFRFAGYEPIARAGDLSPSSTTSVSWDRAWPIKPDIVMEGGNQVRIPGTTTVMDPDEMTILTTAHASTGRLLVDFRDTSAAVAQAARMAAILQAEYPKLWPETIRALLVHSAEGTERMRRSFGTKKTDAINRLRRYGYGVPSLSRAMYSAKSSLTLIAQQTIQPYMKEGSDTKTKEMGLHNFPWPKEQLQALGESTVTMRVTLSYFIEPKPGRRDGFVKYRHRYQSHGLRFEVRRLEETLDQFRQRISKAARDEEEYYEAVGDTAGWTLGPKIRTRGSIHSDWWTGSATALANSGHIAVYPVSGRWREAKGNHWSKQARYALIVTIRTEAMELDLYTPLEAEIDLYTPTKTLLTATVQPPVVVEVEEGS